jgi:HAD superfamily hydrolase (TIGR01509 family)
LTTFRGAILDIDGTLVDSNDAHAASWVEVLKESGREVPFEKVRPLIGMGSDKLLPAVAGIEKESAEGKRLTERRRALFMTKYAPELKPFPRARALVQRMRERGLRAVIASSANEEELKKLIEVAGVGDLIEGKTSSSEVDRSKPDPDVVEVALGDLGLPPHEVVMVGDTPYDIEAAARAGVAVIGLRCGGWGDRDLAGALAIYDDPADLLAQYDASPLAVGTPPASEAEPEPQTLP